jgi:GMP synthase-like glutamine amidotransferase
MEVLILEHDSKEHAGVIQELLEREEIPHHRVLLHEGAALPEPASARCIVAMGGPMSVSEEDRHPFLKGEDAFIRSAVREGVPFLGICLGAQLLAKALDAKVYKAQAPEIGWDDVRLLSAVRQNPLFKGFQPGPLRVFQWHQDTFDLPAGAVHLASSPLVPHQAFSVRGLHYGFQFHLEVTRGLLEAWFQGKPQLAGYLREYEAYADRLRGLTERIVRNFLAIADNAGELKARAGSLPS